ncbi:MAG: NADH-quinone oxidoreductase subunit M [Candidatus Thorarchaeota archaeon]|nr:NADH-quinone oxidoreductase subunit M [Candidatus Thorarchaeota archaeon]
MQAPVEIPFMTLSLVVLFVGGLLIYLLKGKIGDNAGKIAVAFSGLAVALMVPPFFRIVVEGGPAYEGMKWSILLGEFGLYLDGIAFPITFAVVILGFLSTIYAVGYTSHEHSKPSFFANLLFFLMGMQWVTLATNLIEFFIAWELMLVPSYFLILFWGLPETRKRTALKFWLYTQSGAVCILIGFGLLYFLSGASSFELATIQALLATYIGASDLLKLIFILLAAGFLVKMAVFPIHWWLPPVHAEAPTPISVLLSGAMIETGAYALVRFGTITLGPAAASLSFFVAAIGVVTMFYGGFMALVQKDIKRLLAYSSVSQMGYVLFALGTFTVYGVSGGMFHLINHAFSKGLLFMAAGTVMHQTGIRNVDKLGGLSNKMPITAFMAAIGMMSIAGSPPLSGFASEWMMFLGGFHAATPPGLETISIAWLLLSVLAVSSTIMSAGYMLRFFWKVFLGPHPDELEGTTEGPRWMTIPMIVLGFLIVLFGIFSGLALDIIVPAVEAIPNIIPFEAIHP